MIIKSEGESAFKLLLDNGVDAKGDPAYKTKTYSNVSGTATDDDIYEIGSGFGQLQEKSVAGVYRVDTHLLEKSEA